MEPPEVECYAGASYPERPRAFIWQGSRYSVETIASGWNSPDERGFQVQTTDGSVFNLIYRPQADLWRVEPQPASAAESDVEE
ncbi:MAG: hypothetical protein JXA25_12065 [Anaerolineales bacterium]|nr:hypothetical protein [Anaerolineales bacterium]